MDIDLIAGYKLLETIYTNPHVKIVRAERLQDKKIVILKFPANKNPSSHEITRLYHEYHLLKTLNLPYLIHPHELIEQSHYPILVLENVAGQSLQTVLEKKPIELNDFFKLALQFVDTIGALHAKHLIHKDITPANFIFDPTSLTITLIDVSISSQLTEENLNYLSLNTLKGTLAYMSPEQTGRMNLPLDYRTDFYSLGVTFFEMLTGQLPFPMGDPLEMAHYHISKIPLLVNEIDPQIPSAVADIISKLLSKMPEDRYASAIGLKEDLTLCAREWQEKNKITPFALGKKDVKDQLKISHKLFGRDLQVQQLLSAFDRVSQQGSSELLLISGYSGIGKTALVREVYKPIVRQKGYFISGKYDQLQRGTPYTAIIAAFQNLVRQVLADTEGNYHKIKQNILDVIGNIGQVIIDLIPEVEFIIGKQPPVTFLGVTETQNRFNLVFQKFIRVFATAEHPLVIFLDDLQWADGASLNFIENLFLGSQTKHLLFIGAYRANEVPIDHPLLATIDRLQKKGVATESIILHSLQMSHIEQLLAETFDCDTTRVTSLADLLYEKTAGNPLFICEFLKALYQDQQIYFAYAQGEWQWDMITLKCAEMTQSIVDLLSTQIRKLPENTQHILKLAACIGNTFNLQTLVIISERTALEVAQELWKVMQARFIIALEDSNKTAMLAEASRLVIDLTKTEVLYYQFHHDRVQHAAYSLIPESTRQLTHLQIGRLLLKEHPLQENDNQIFNIVNHFNQSISLITDAAERRSLAQYNFWAGHKAKISSAYLAALNYFEVTQAFLSTDAWKKDYDFTFSLYLELAECSFLAGQLQKADSFFTVLFTHAQNKFDTIRVYEVKMTLCNMLTQYQEVIELGLAGLKLLGMRLPSRPNIAQVLLSILEVSWQIAFKKIENIELAPMQDQRKIYMSRLLATMAASAYFSNTNLLAIVLGRLIVFTLKYGFMEESAFACIGYAFMFICTLNQWEKGFSFCTLGQKLMEKSPDITKNVKTRTAYLGVIHHWKYPAAESLDMLLKEAHIATEAGALGYAGYSFSIHVMISQVIGRPLEEVMRSTKTCLSFLVNHKISESQKNMKAIYSVIQGLQGVIPLAHASLSYDEEHIETWGNKAEINQISYHLIRLHYLLGNKERACQLSIKNEPYNDFAKGQIQNVEGKVYYALCLLACYPQASSVVQKVYLTKIKKISHQLKQWASYCPVNFRHYELLVSAEMMAILPEFQGKILETIDLYDRAIVTATENAALNMEAIANDLAADFCMRVDQAGVAHQYRLQAYQAFQKWGAIAKCQLMEKSYPKLVLVTADEADEVTIKSVSSHTTTTVSYDFDMMAALKSTLAISSEIQLDKLLQKLLRIMLEDAGAQRCVLLGKQSESWIIEAEGTAEKRTIFLQPQMLTTTSELPTTLISYVQRTLEPLVIQDAMHAEQTLSDPYIIKAKPKSILMLPIRYQGQLHRIFYLENNLTTGAFTSQHLQMLQLLGTQAAISLENAHFYYQATHDPLTGLANRNLLYQTFQGYVHSPERREDEKIAILFLDLDRFKPINDTLGHEIGDKLLLHVTEQLKTCLRNGDLAVRLGGDEFVLMIKNIKSKAQIKAMIDKLDRQLSRSASIAGHQLSISTSIGVSIYPDEGTDIHTLLRIADIALYREKEIHHRQKS